MPNIIKKVIISGAEKFLALADTPITYLGQGGRTVQVDPSETKLIFSDVGAPVGLLGNWNIVQGTTVAAGELAINNLDPTLITSLVYANTDAAGTDRTSPLHFLVAGDRMQILATVGAKEYYFLAGKYDDAYRSRDYYLIELGCPSPEIVDTKTRLVNNE